MCRRRRGGIDDATHLHSIRGCNAQTPSLISLAVGYAERDILHRVYSVTPSISLNVSVTKQFQPPRAHSSYLAVRKYRAEIPVAFDGGGFRFSAVRFRASSYSHSYLLSGADQPECTTCQCPLTVKHILVECTDFNDTRTKYLLLPLWNVQDCWRT